VRGNQLGKRFERQWNLSNNRDNSIGARETDFASIYRWSHPYQKSKVLGAQRLQAFFLVFEVELSLVSISPFVC
jgi:hypothetical protein